MIDIVQVNIYGQTLSEMLQKGVDIPHWLESFGIEHCAVFDVPWTSSSGDFSNGEMSASSYGSSNSSDCSFREDLSTFHQSLDDTVKVEQDEMNEVAEQVNVGCSTSIRVTNTGLTSALLNCSFSSIRRDDYSVGELDENCIVHEDPQDLGMTRSLKEFSLPLQRQTEVVQISRFDLLTFNDSVMDVMLDLLDNVDNQELCSKDIVRTQSSDETIPFSNFFSKSTDHGVSVQDVESVDYVSACDNNSSQLSPTSQDKNVTDKNTNCLSLESLYNTATVYSDDHVSNTLSNVIETKEQSLTSAIRVAMDCINDIDTSDHLNPLHIQETHSEVGVENTKDIPDDDALQMHELDVIPVPPPKKQRIDTISNADCNKEIDSNNTQNYECEELESVAENMQMMEDEDFGAMDDDISKEETLSVRNSNATNNFMDGLKINLKPCRDRRDFFSGNGKLRMNIGKLQRAITHDSRIVKCSYKGCTSRLLLRHGYGRDRLIKHARTHITSTTYKCSHCPYATNTENAFRFHHNSKHRGIKWAAPPKEETVEEIQNLIKIFNECFPGSSAKFNIGHINQATGNKKQPK